MLSFAKCSNYYILKVSQQYTLIMFGLQKLYKYFQCQTFSNNLLRLFK